MKYITSFWTVAIVIVLGLVIRVADIKPVEQIRLMGFDAKIQSIPQTKSEDIVLLDISEETLGKWGQYPLPRQYYAQIISDLINANAGIKAFTIMFPEPDRLGGDPAFESWIKGSGVVLSQKADARGRNDVAPYVGTAQAGEGDPYQFVQKYNKILTNIPMLEDDAWGIGMINVSPEIDGLVRRMPLVVQANNKLYPSLPVEIIRAEKQTKGYTIKTEETGVVDLFIPPKLYAETDNVGRVWINPSIKFDRYSAGVDVLPDLQGKTVLIGVSALGIVPQSPTPSGLKLPHEIQASVLATILEGGLQASSSIIRPIWANLLEISLILIGSLLILVCSYRFSAYYGAIAFVTALVASYFSSAYFWSNSMYLLDWTFAIVLYIIVFAHASFNNFWIQFKLRQQIKGQFGTYLSPDMVNMLIKDPSLMKLGGDRKEMTFLFMDICGFTPISEHYKNNDDPEGLVELVNEFLDAMTKIILKNGGTIDKYMGDCIMAFWNAPLPCTNHAEMAVKSAIEIEEKVNELKEVYKERGLPDINVGTGINTGDCIVGNMGSESRFDYSVIGDAVNLAARLEATAARHEYIDHKTIYSSFTMKELPSGYVSHEIGKIKVKGKEELITIYSPTAKK
jgi:adenylate cyclase